MLEQPAEKTEEVEEAVNPFAVLKQLKPKN